MTGLRTRLAVTLVLLVALTVAAIGIGVYAFVDASLRSRAVADARQQADFNLSVLLPAQVPPPSDAASFAASGLPEAFRLRGEVETIADFGDGNPYTPARLLGTLDEISPDLRAIVASGQLGYALADARREPRAHRRRARGRWAGPVLRVPDHQRRCGARAASPRAPAGGLIAVLVALVTAGFIARGILRPVDDAARAARRIAGGDLTARVPAGGRDEFGRWGAEFNRMADTLETTVGRLEASQQQNRRFTADVAHELRTPLTALVAEASLIETGLDGMSPDGRRAAQLLVADVRRLRDLVDELMEVSRFDADAETVSLRPVDLGRLVTAVVSTRLPGASITLPREPVIVASDPRRLDRIVGNLVDNARDHAPGGPVEVSLSMTMAGATIVVADRGPGVPADALPRLFDRFYKADPSRTGGSSGGSASRSPPSTPRSSARPCAPASDRAGAGVHAHAAGDRTVTRERSCRHDRDGR